MANVKEEEEEEENKNKQSSSSNIKEEQTKEFLDNQKQQLENRTTSTISETINNTNDNINTYRQVNKEIIEKNFDIANKYQQQINNIIQRITDNYIETQKNFLYNYQPILSQFIDNTFRSLSNIRVPERYADEDSKSNQNITYNTTNANRILNDFVLAYIETFNKSIEIAQKYYNEFVQNYFNFVNKIGRSYYYSNQ